MNFFKWLNDAFSRKKNVTHEFIPPELDLAQPEEKKTMYVVTGAVSLNPYYDIVTERPGEGLTIYRRVISENGRRINRVNHARQKSQSRRWNKKWRHKR